MTTRIDFTSIAIIVLTLLLLPAVPLGGTVSHETTFKFSGNGNITLTDVHSGESVSVTYRDKNNNYDHKALDSINKLLRCHGDGKIHPISLKLVEFLDYLQDSLASNEVFVASGYRSPDFNTNLSHHLRRAARDSLHTQGMAVDIKLPDIGKKTLARLAVESKFGGVGTYRSSAFIHVDSGPIRNW